jgi:hypothetical protein
MQTTSLATSKALYDRGVRVESFNCHILENRLLDNTKYYTLSQESFCYLTNQPDVIYVDDYDFILGEEAFPAYTLDELLGILPPNIEFKENNADKENLDLNDPDGKYYLRLARSELWYRYKYDCDIQIGNQMNIENVTEAAGLMLLWLIDNGYVDVNKLNEGV